MQTSTRPGLDFQQKPVSCFPPDPVSRSQAHTLLTLFSHVSVSQDQDVGVTRARAWHWLCQGPHTSSTRGCLASSFSLHEWFRPFPGVELSHVTELQDPCDNPSLCYWSVRSGAGGGNLSMLFILWWLISMPSIDTFILQKTSGKHFIDREKL